MSSAVNLVNGVFYPERVSDLLDKQAAQTEDARFDANINVRLRLRRRLGRSVDVPEDIDVIDIRDLELMQMTTDMCCLTTAETIDEMFNAFYGTGDFEWISRIVRIMEATSCVSALLAGAWTLHTLGRLGIVDLLTLTKCPNKPAWVELEQCEAMIAQT